MLPGFEIQFLVMKRKMLNVKLKDRIIRQRTRVTDIVDYIANVLSCH